jgi:hypothetical protein
MSGIVFKTLRLEFFIFFIYTRISLNFYKKKKDTFYAILIEFKTSIILLLHNLLEKILLCLFLEKQRKKKVD